MGQDGNSYFEEGAIELVEGSGRWRVEIKDVESENLCSSAPEALHWHCCRSRASRKDTATAASRSVAFRYATSQRSVTAIMPKFTARRRKDRHRCPCRIST